MVVFIHSFRIFL